MSVNTKYDFEKYKENLKLQELEDIIYSENDSKLVDSLREKMIKDYENITDIKHYCDKYNLYYNTDYFENCFYKSVLRYTNKNAAVVMNSLADIYSTEDKCITVDSIPINLSDNKSVKHMRSIVKHLNKKNIKKTEMIHEMEKIYGVGVFHRRMWMRWDFSIFQLAIMYSGNAIFSFLVFLSLKRIFK